MLNSIVISDTTLILTLSGIGKLEILRELYQKIFIPKAVANEILEANTKAVSINIFDFDWIEIKEITRAEILNLLDNLDEGEAEAIALTEKMNADLLIIDEKLARKIAQQKGLRVTGTLGVILKSKEVGIISEVRPLITKIQQNGIWLSDNLIRQVLIEANEI